MIFLGQGTPQDQQQALLLSEKAARNGSTDALLLLSHIFYKGEGASRNLIEALKWADIAVDLYSPEAQEVRDLIAEEMSSSEINTANELANEWLDNDLYSDVIEIDIH